MRAGIVRAGLRAPSLAQIRYVSRVPLRSAPPPVARVYRAVESEFGVLAPPLALHAPVPDLLAGAWLMVRESLLVDGAVSRELKESVAVAVSESNRCPFCMSVHGAMMDSLLGDGSTDRPQADDLLRAARSWTAATTAQQAGSGPGPALSAAGKGELVAVAVMMHYLNRMVNVFLGELPVPPGLPAGSLVAIGPVLLWLQRSAQRTGAPPGADLDLLPPAAFPADPSWAPAVRPELSEAFARAGSAVETVAARVSAPEVLDLVREAVDAQVARPGDTPAPDLAAAVADLPVRSRPAARFALTVALESYRVAPELIGQVIAGAQSSADETLLGLAAWAALTAARAQARALARVIPSTARPNDAA